MSFQFTRNESFICMFRIADFTECYLRVFIFNCEEFNAVILILLFVSLFIFRLWSTIFIMFVNYVFLYFYFFFLHFYQFRKVKIKSLTLIYFYQQHTHPMSYPWYNNMQFFYYLSKTLVAYWCAEAHMFRIAPYSHTYKSTVAYLVKK